MKTSLLLGTVLASAFTAVNASAGVSTDVSACLGQPEPCYEQDEGFTEFDTQFCIGQATDYALSGTEMASSSEDGGEIIAVSALTITSLTSDTELVNLQSFNGVTTPPGTLVMLAKQVKQLIS